MKVGTSERTVDQDNFQEDIEDVEEHPLVRRSSRHVRYANTEEPEQMQRTDSSPQNNRGFPSEEVLYPHHAFRKLYVVQIVVSSQLTVLLPFFHCKVGWHFVRRA